MTAGLSVRLLRDPEQLLLIAAECDELARRMQPRVPFATSTWLLSWWNHYREDRLPLRDRWFVHALRDAQGALVALAPLMFTERPGIGPVRSRALSFFGGDKNVSELRGLVCAPEHEAAAARALLDHLLTQDQRWDWLVWQGVHRGSAAHALLSASQSFEWISETTDYVLPLSNSWSEFRASRSRNIKESLRKCYNSLARDGHSFEFRVVAEPSALRAALPEFFALHARRAHAAGLPEHSDVFESPQARALLLDLAASPTPALSLRVFQLEIAGQRVAARVGFVLGDELYLYFSGYDPAWAAYSVMTTTVAEAIKWAIENQFRLVNLSPGTDVSKTRWGAQGITTCNGVLRSPRPQGQLMFRLLSELNALSRPGALLARVMLRARRRG